MKEIEEELEKKNSKNAFLFLNKMESLQSLSARVLAKNDFNENFLHKKLMCHWEIRNSNKQQIFDEFSVYENLCLEIEKILDNTYEISEKYYSFINSATNGQYNNLFYEIVAILEPNNEKNYQDPDEIREFLNESIEILDWIIENEKSIQKKVQEKKSKEKKIEEIILKFDEVHDDYQDFDEDGYDKNITAKESIEIEEIEIIKDSLGDYIEKDYLYGIETIKEFLEKNWFLFEFFQKTDFIWKPNEINLQDQKMTRSLHSSNH